MSYHSQRRYEVSQAITDELEQESYKVEDEWIPKAAEADERNGALYDSKRDYLTQIEAYQARKDNVEYEDDEIA